jgi:hypothetical protein
MRDERRKVCGVAHWKPDASSTSRKRSEQPGLAQPLPEDPIGVAAAPVRVQDRAGLRRGVPAGHLQGVHDRLRAHVIGDRPAHDPA